MCQLSEAEKFRSLALLVIEISPFLLGRRTTKSRRRIVFAGILYYYYYYYYYYCSSAFFSKLRNRIDIRFVPRCWICGLENWSEVSFSKFNFRACANRVQSFTCYFNGSIKLRFSQHLDKLETSWFQHLVAYRSRIGACEIIFQNSNFAHAQIVFEVLHVIPMGAYHWVFISIYIG